MNHPIEPWYGGFGVEVTARSGEAVSAVDIARLRELIVAHGFVLLRGFHVDVDGLQSLTGSLFERRLVYGGARERVSADDTIQTVDLGKHDIGLHCELAYTPVRPDLVVFSCQVPASDGGETTVGDGTKIYEALSASTRELLAQKRVKYMNIIRRGAWQRMFGVATPEQFAPLLARMSNVVNPTFDAEGTLTGGYVVPALVPNRRGKTAYATSIAIFEGTEPEAYTDGLLKTWSMLEDGPLPDAVRAELRDVCKQYTVPIRWQPGDVALIDNSSVLHGRTAYSDPRRRILAAFGYASWARPAG